MDQAEKLRKLAKSTYVPEKKGHSRVIAIASGKGGVGKTNFSVNLALALRDYGQKVVILDGDLGMANIDVICGMSPKFNLGHVLNRSKSLEEIVLTFNHTIRIIPGVSGVESLTSLNPKQLEYFFSELSRFDANNDINYVIIDIGAGMGPTVINFLLAADEDVIITTPEPTALMDAYAVIKTLLSKKDDARVDVVVNIVKSQEEGQRVFQSMSMITKQFLNQQLNYLGYILDDPIVPRSVKQQSPFVLSSPNSNASKCVREIARKLINKDHISAEGGIKSFFERMYAFIGG